MRHDVLVADVADDQFRFAREILGPLPIAVHLLDQAIEHSDLIAAAKQLARNCAPDKPRAAGNQDSVPQSSILPSWAGAGPLPSSKYYCSWFAYCRLLLQFSSDTNLDYTDIADASSS